MIKLDAATKAALERKRNLDESRLREIAGMVRDAFGLPSEQRIISAHQGSPCMPRRLAMYLALHGNINGNLAATFFGCNRSLVYKVHKEIDTMLAALEAIIQAGENGVSSSEQAGKKGKQ